MPHPLSPVIHIGYHKTATTWFQRQFYPAVRGSFFAPRELARETLIAPKAFEFSSNRARAALEQAAEGRRLLVCEENLSGYLHNGGLGGLMSREIAQRLHACFPDATIVVFLRAQPHMFEAAYAQYVRGGGTHTIDRYLRAEELASGARGYWYKAPLFSWTHYDYAPLLDHYSALFGRERLHVCLYEAFAADNRAFLEAFARSLDFDADWPSIALTTQNVSPSARELAILRRLNLGTARSVMDKRYLRNSGGWYRKRWQVLRWLRGWPVSKRGLDAVTLSATLRGRIVEYYGQRNADLATRYQLPLAAFGYPFEGR